MLDSREIDTFLQLPPINIQLITPRPSFLVADWLRGRGIFWYISLYICRYRGKITVYAPHHH
jgi:hypothetical protein